MRSCSSRGGNRIQNCCWIGGGSIRSQTRKIGFPQRFFSCAESPLTRKVTVFPCYASWLPRPLFRPPTALLSMRCRSANSVAFTHTHTHSPTHPHIDSSWHTRSLTQWTLRRWRDEAPGQRTASSIRHSLNSIEFRPRPYFPSELGWKQVIIALSANLASLKGSTSLAPAVAFYSYIRRGIPVCEAVVVARCL